MKKIFILNIIITITATGLLAQIYNRNNLFYTDLYSLNTAAVHVDTSWSANLYSNFANVGFEGSPNTFSIMAHGPINETTGVGIRVFNDARGAFRTNSFLLSYAHKLRFNEEGHNLSLGLSAGMYMQNFQIGEITAVNMNDPGLLNNDYENKGKFVNEFSALYRNKNLTIGFSAPYVVQLYNHYIGHVSYFYDLPSAEGFSITPMLLYQYLPEGISQLDAIAKFQYKPAWLAFTYRSNNNFLTAVGFQYRKYELAYSFEVNHQPLSAISGSTHEIMLRYHFNIDFTRKKPSYNKDVMPWQNAE